MSLKYFIDGWWHGAELDVALEQLRRAFDRVGLTDIELPEELLRERTRALYNSDADEEIFRWHQIGIVAVAANVALAAAGSTRRVRALHADAIEEADEPAWVIVESDEELAQLRAQHGAPEGLEALYDAAERPEDVAVDAPAALTPDPYLAVLSSERALRERRYQDALVLAEVGARDGSHGILAELVRIQALVALSRHADARVAWESSARAWLAGERQVFDTQWKELARLHARVARPDDELTAQVAGKAAG